MSTGEGCGDRVAEAGDGHMQERTLDDVAWPEAGTEERSCNRYGEWNGEHEGTSCGPAYEYGPDHSHRVKVRSVRQTQTSRTNK